MLFEVCVTTPASALAAARAGAHRLELCSALDTGGLTPSAGLIRQVVRLTALPVYVLIRPREGSFFYSAEERALMLDDIGFCRSAGAGGVVIGALDAAGRLDAAFIGEMVAAARGLDVTLHRAFDLTPDPEEALDAAIALGIPRILTSGQAATAWEGRDRLRRLVDQGGARIAIMPGAGIRASNIRALAGATGAREFHFSGREKVEGDPTGRRLPGLEADWWESREETIRGILAAAS